MPWLQKSSPKFDFFALDEDLQFQILDICRHDIAFQIFPDYWAPYAQLVMPNFIAPGAAMTGTGH